VILDTSAMVSLLLLEDGHEDLEEKIRSAHRVAIGAPTLAEAMNVMISRLGEAGLEMVVRFIGGMRVEVVRFDVRHADMAGQAVLRFGKGRHPARLNYGDCMTYATARIADEPLLFIGNDFARTDIAAA
jgi:ribonuclease VapC